VAVGRFVESEGPSFGIKRKSPPRSVFNLALEQEKDRGTRRSVEVSISRYRAGSSSRDRQIGFSGDGCLRSAALARSSRLKETRTEKWPLHYSTARRWLTYDVPSRELRDVNVTSTLSRYCCARPVVSFLLHVNKIYI